MKSRFLELSDLLNSCRQFWSVEVIDQYPQCFESYPETWVDEISRLSAEQLFELEHHRSLGSITEPGLRSYYEAHWRLAELPTAVVSENSVLGHKAFFRVSEKKRHEISVVCELVVELCRRQAIDTVVDFGGGVGYLAQALAHYYQVPTISLDRDRSLQETGMKRHQRRKPADSSELQYVEMDCPANGSASELPGDGKRLLLGLHTCGPLANAQLTTAVREKCPAVLNFSCCYHKLCDTDYYLSEHGKQSDLRLTSEALTLACRSPRYGRKAHDFSKRVKFYRYSIHLFLYHELGIRQFRALGNSPRRLYEGDFVAYGLEQLGRIDLPTDESMAKALAAFAEDENYQQTVRKMVAANIIRSAATRGLELLLLFDRAIYLSEQGYTVEMAEYFDDLLSPRNIGIVALQ